MCFFGTVLNPPELPVLKAYFVTGLMRARHEMAKTSKFLRALRNPRFRV